MGNGYTVILKSTDAGFRSSVSCLTNSLQHFVLTESVMKPCKKSATEIVHLSHLSSCRVAIVALQPSCFEQYQRDVIHKKKHLQSPHVFSIFECEIKPAKVQQTKIQANALGSIRQFVWAGLPLKPGNFWSC